MAAVHRVLRHGAVQHLQRGLDVGADGDVRVLVLVDLRRGAKGEMNGK